MTRDEQAIREAQAAWLEATASGDLPRLLSLMADDVVFLQPGRPPFGREEFAAMFEAGQRQVRISCSGELEEIVVAGDVAYVRSRLAASVVPLAGGPGKQLAGYTLSVFRRQPNGHWVLARDANLLSPVPSPS
ncbi:MAG TPA: SgcJ/EcaC family oxidoreductase [Gemmataceae bacterium]|nr:SgcJ/EcaC family oxidoreductase [Gemmataceae bacterium]